MWPTIPYTPKLSGKSDQTLEEMLIDLERLQVSGYLRVIKHAGEPGIHLKLVMNDKQLISLFAWNYKIFQGKRTLVRSYGVWPIDVMEVDEEEGDRVLAEGEYVLDSGKFRVVVKRSFDGNINPSSWVYRLKLLRIREYISPKHGLSVRPEYLLLPQ